MGSCKCCEAKLEKSILEYKNMPNSAQGFLEQEDIKNDIGQDLEVFQCKFCGLVQLDCEPVPYYKNVIRSTGFSDEMQRFRNEFFKDFVSKYDLTDKKVIEIGCGRRRIYACIRKCNQYESFWN